MRLKDKIAVITGSARGIGKAIALKFAQEGAAVVISDLTLESCQETASEIEAITRTKTLALAVDVTNSTSVEEMVKTVKKEWGRIDILVNNAGITKDTLLMRMSPDAWNAVIQVNLTGTFNCIKAVTRLMMKQQYGRIVNIASVVGLMGNAGQANYVASKAGVIGLTKSVARELASRNITANAIAPGFIQTPMTDKLTEDTIKNYLSRIPLGRMGTPEDVAKAAMFLVSSDADYITGQVLTIDGGMYM